MKYFWIFSYNLIGYPILVLIGFIYSLFNAKLREGIRGRLRAIHQLKNYFNSHDINKEKYWFHAASLGEFYQVKPVMDGLKEVEPDCCIILSFSSPSGFNNARCNVHDLMIYLPFDFPWTILKAFKIVKPKKLIFASYDIWPNLIWLAERKKIHTNIFAARVKDGSQKLKPAFFNFYQNVYRSFSTIYTVSEKDYLRLKTIRGNFRKPILRSLGNPRYDLVKQSADEFSLLHQKSVLERNNRLIIGSAHSEDDKILIPAIMGLMKSHPDLNILYVPHEPSDAVVANIQDQFSKTNFISTLFQSKANLKLPDQRLIIVGVVGVLSKLYWQSRYTYIGGGFSTGIHNVMEPAIARLPVIFGPKYHHAHEAEELIEKGGGFSIENEHDFLSIMDRLISQPDFYEKTSSAATDVIHDNLGSSTRIVRGIIRD